MTIKRLILVVLTIFAIAKVSLSLVESWGQPQIQSRLELYQTNLLLHASEWQPNADPATPSESNPDLTSARNTLIGTNPLKTAQNQYQEARESAQEAQSKIVAKLQKLSTNEVAVAEDAAKPQLQVAPVADTPGSSQQRQQWEMSLSQVGQLIDELDLRLGILQSQQGKTDAALQTWSKFTEQQTQESLIQTAQVLTGLWSEPPRLLPDAESQIQKNLDSWFRYRALTKLYQLQQRQDALASLQTEEQKIAEQAILKLGVIGGIPGFGGLLGLILLLFLLSQRLFRGERSLLATNADVAWETPWDWEIIWQVLIFGFFFIGQLALPILFSVLGVNPVGFTVRMKAFYVLVSYLLMATGGLLVMYLSIKPFLPVPEDWFRFKFRSNWILWGLGGYLVALPLVILVSLINQRLWNGQGGSNPILPLALEGRDNVALLIFFLTACVAAPIFEEIIFRGFLLPSLTRYVPVWGAILASSLLFAIAHLSLSEVLPLATLGMVLGIVYSRSRNLLASMLLHGLWNAGTLLSLFVLGSGSN
ncbi:CPBP family intramembrane metalloprotease [Microcoleus sp. FACHB-SPT15]|uniref:CPBP family intramembrane glutamic endopeptidase n=1 Tax=Microcoleus sp. FACHB-SPT15 TaxID=2692830 RepID=UPI00177D8F20|nr:CPBP family glutamic-type intramembrane protease [Microcoleus sp. FACHB-SPT15]MBD1806741.1 CPBP family intramembrane metalloprotease [Microcoleus sp. FACHB-SPT15]